MSFKQFFPIPVGIAVLATTLMALDLVKGPVLPHFLPWVSFQAWAMYFMAGCTFKGGGKVMLGYLGGAVASVAIIELAGVFGGWGLGNAGILPAVFIVVVPVICAERVPGFDFVPAWFVGAGVFFGLFFLTAWPEGTSKVAKHGTTGAHLMVSCAVGMIYGVVTVAFRSRYEAWLKKGQPAEAPAE